MRKTKTVKVTYKFKIGYESEEHLQAIIKDLKSAPINDMCGAGGTKTDGCCGYSYKRIGKGIVVPNMK